MLVRHRPDGLEATASQVAKTITVRHRPDGLEETKK